MQVGSVRSVAARSSVRATVAAHLPRIVRISIAR
jgi:hypothetical protein